VLGSFFGKAYLNSSRWKVGSGTSFWKDFTQFGFKLGLFLSNSEILLVYRVENGSQVTLGGLLLTKACWFLVGNSGNAFRVAREDLSWRLFVFARNIQRFRLFWRWNKEFIQKWASIGFRLFLSRLFIGMRGENFFQLLLKLFGFPWLLASSHCRHQ